MDGRCDTGLEVSRSKSGYRLWRNQRSLGLNSSHSCSLVFEVDLASLLIRVVGLRGFSTCSKRVAYLTEVHVLGQHVLQDLGERAATGNRGENENTVENAPAPR